MNATMDGYRIEANTDDHGHRLDAVTEDGRVIAGAYRPIQLNDWRVWLAKDFVGDLPQPSKVHVVSRADAIRWLDVLASYYMRATNDGSQFEDSNDQKGRETA